MNYIVVYLHGIHVYVLCVTGLNTAMRTWLKFNNALNCVTCADLEEVYLNDITDHL